MPNHVTNILTFKGSVEDIKALKKHIASVDNEGYEMGIDFDKIIPMPESLKITSGLKVDNGIAVLKFTKENDDTELKKMLAWPWVKAENITTTKQLADHLINKKNINLEVAEIALDNIKKYGFKDWYSWSVANWGTKWNAYDISVGDNSISFDTAWSSPVPVIEELSSQFPTIEIELQFVDEDFGHNCGIIVFLAGDAIKENIPDGGTPEAYGIAAKIQGREIDDLMCYICESEDEEFVKTMISIILELHNVEKFIYYIQTEDAEYFSREFLQVAKTVFLDIEAYEHISAIEDLLKQKVEEE